jgi:hypothetical protein
MREEACFAIHVHIGELISLALLGEVLSLLEKGLGCSFA